MKTYALALGLLLEILACPTQFSIEHSHSCKFYVLYSNDTCSSFTFDKCKWTQCTKYDQQSQCQNYGTSTSYDWNFCTRKCCYKSLDTYPPTSDGISQCQANFEDSILVPIIIGGAFAFVFFLCVCCVVCNSPICKDQNGHWKCCCCKYQQRNRDYQNPEPHSQEVNVNSINEMANMLSQWISQNLSASKIKTECAVCLEEKPSLQLECGHIYHRKCIVQCLKRKQECILCRSTKFNFIKIYCESCFNHYFHTYLMQNMSTLQSQPQFCTMCKGFDGTL